MTHSVSGAFFAEECEGGAVTEADKLLPEVEEEILQAAGADTVLCQGLQGRIASSCSQVHGEGRGLFTCLGPMGTAHMTATVLTGPARIESGATRAKSTSCRAKAHSLSWNSLVLCGLGSFTLTSDLWSHLPGH